MIDLYEAEVPLKYRREINEEPMRRAQVEVRETVVLDSTFQAQDTKKDSLATFWPWNGTPGERGVSVH